MGLAPLARPQQGLGQLEGHQHHVFAVAERGEELQRLLEERHRHRRPLERAEDLAAAPAEEGVGQILLAAFPGRQLELAQGRLEPLSRAGGSAPG